ncbi:MAG: DUF4278 domain-containing protein [Waterburya sp.]
MKLRYRGIEYDYNPPAVTVQEGEIGGKYRGLDWRFHNLKHPLVIQPTLNLTYRGVKYSNQPVSAPTERQKVTSVGERARWLAIKREKAAQNRQASLLHRTSEEIGSV